jgi:hypothetical protein
MHHEFYAPMFHTDVHLDTIPTKVRPRTESFTMDLDAHDAPHFTRQAHSLASAHNFPPFPLSNDGDSTNYLYGANNMQRSAFRWSGGPFWIWAELAWKATEVMLASAQVIGHRTHLMRAAGSSPSPSDWREMQLMWQEKMEAARESAFGMTAELTRMNLQFGAQAFANLVHMSLATLALAGSVNPTQSLQRQSKMIRDGIGRSMITASTLSSSSGRLTHRGLKPIHKRATRNAKRLGKRP